MTIITWKGYSLGGEDGFRSFKAFLGLGETLFGVYLGQIVLSLFKEKA